TPTSAWTNGTGRTRSSGTVTACSAPTSSTIGVTRRWGAPGATSTSPHWDARRSGRTRRTDTPERRPTRGGDGTTRTVTPTPHGEGDDDRRPDRANHRHAGGDARDRRRMLGRRGPADERD